MTTMLNGLSMSAIWGNMTDVFSAISPYLVAILGVLLAFFIINTLVGFLTPKQNDDKSIL